MLGLIKALSELVGKTNKDGGKKLLEFIVNRYEASVYHINALLALKRVLLENATAETIEEALREGKHYAELYLTKTAEALPDRGGEGQIVDYAEHMAGYIKHLRKCFIEQVEDTVVREDSTTKAPPPPASI